MHILMTTDTIGGVWNYTLSLVRTLTDVYGVRITLVTLGNEPHADQIAALHRLSKVDFIPTTFKLEWMANPTEHLEHSAQLVMALARWRRVDLIHSNQFAYGNLELDIPRVVVAHSDLLSWLHWCGGEPPETDIEPYKRLVVDGLQGASAIVCPSNFMKNNISEYYHPSTPIHVIYNGLPASDFAPGIKKPGTALMVGRLWDRAKNARVVLEALNEKADVQLTAVGPAVGPGGERLDIHNHGSITHLGELPYPRVIELYAQTSIYVAASMYEPFGLAALEAAFSGCAILANDVPFHREIWDDDAIYFERNCSEDLRAKLETLAHQPDVAAEWGKRARQHALANYTARRMAEEYHSLYQSILGVRV
ncbi:MAG: glycosyltransferase family 4 protein [Chloroflexi bacterium]|nr:glycosyltransferase family 4 protein [Chloroflexota bacterium]